VDGFAVTSKLKIRQSRKVCLDSPPLGLYICSKV